MEHNSHNRGNLRKLPTQLTSFVAREIELTEISSLQSDADCRLLSLIGPGGIGKTRLAIQAAELGFSRDSSQCWLLTYRGYRYGQPVGYGYLGVRNGSSALLESDDFPAVPAHAKSQAAAQGRREFGLELPMVNQVAVDHLLGRGFKMHSFVAIMMNDQPFTKFENYILASPQFFL